MGTRSGQAMTAAGFQDGPAQAYRDLIADGAISYDAAQDRAAERLQRLHEALKTYTPVQRTGGLLSFLSGGPEPVTAPCGLYMCGDVGRGKSMLMDLFFDSAPAEPKRRVHFHAFMLEIHEAIRSWRAMTEAQKRQRLRTLGLPSKTGDDPIPPVAKAVADAATLLCFDELQVTDVADALILGRLFQALFDHGVVVVCTSNRAPRDLYKNGINRQLFLPFIDLILERMETLHLDARTDYRLEQLAGGPVYFTPADAVARARLAEAWAAVTGGADGAPVDLSVQGRVLRVPWAAARAAWFTFADLCERPLGAADYLAIATRYDTVFLEAIPVLGPEKRNEARRFVTLIDALYENKVKLMASADAAPADLYPAGDGAFEFGRTVSRLIEMQSADYPPS